MTKSTFSRLGRLDQRLAPARFLTGGNLKAIALVLMVAEHFFKCFTGPIIHHYDTPAAMGMQDFAIRTVYPLTSIAFPLFAFLLTEGFTHTHDRPAYRRSMLLFALISELPLDLVFISCGWTMSSFGLTQGGPTVLGVVYLGYQNIFFTLYLGLWTMELLHKLERERTGWQRFLGSALVIGALGLISALTRCDYGFGGILLIALLYLSRKNRLYQCAVYPLFMIVLHNEQPGLHELLYCALLFFYNGKRRRRGGEVRRPGLKYAAYAVYPAHLLLYALLRFSLNGMGC